MVDADACKKLEYAPAVQSEHAGMPVAAAYAPAPQRTQLDIPEEEYCPSMQDWQDVELVAPVAEENIPAEQRLQLCDEVDPEADENMPSKHEVHDADEVAPVSLKNRPGAHAVHTTAPLEAAKLPAPQIEQAWAPLNEYCPATQLEHAVDATAASLAENDPATQFTQYNDADAPVAAE